MTLVPASAFNVNQLFLPPDPTFNPLPVGLPDCVLEESAPPVDVADYPTWEKTLAYLPQARRNRLKKCRKTALHIRKTGELGGTSEALHAVACGDRAACPACATRYAHERAWTGAQRMATVSLTASNFGVAAPAPVYALSFRAVIPEWGTHVQMKGCEQSESWGRLCPSNSGCVMCEGTARTAAAAAQVEADVARWCIDRWLALRGESGGVRHVSIHQETPTSPIVLIVTLHVPAVAAKVAPGAKIMGIARAQRRSFLPLSRTEVETLKQDWLTFVTANYGAPAATLEGSAPTTWEEIWASFRKTHTAPLARWAAMLEDPTIVVTPDTVQTFLRAVGLGVIGSSGKARRVQRTSWFGIFGGKHQLEVMHALDIYPQRRQPHATIEVVDAVRVLGRDTTHTRAQSIRDGQVKLFPNSMCRLMDTVDSLGRPSQPTSDTLWEHYEDTRMVKLSRLYKAQQRLVRIDAGGVQIAIENSDMQSEPTLRQTAKQRLKAIKLAHAEAFNMRPRTR